MELILVNIEIIYIYIKEISANILYLPGTSILSFLPNQLVIIPN